jgi:hypothetical protein
MYDDTIMAIPFLQKREDIFYLHYLDKLKPMRFDEGQDLM